MGRLAAYLGPRSSVAALLEGGSYSLAQQSTDHADGFGLAWYPEDGRQEPVRLLSDAPAGRADHLLEVPRRYGAQCAVASIRKADHLPADPGGAQPFAAGNYLFAYDGVLENYEEVFLRPLREGLSDVQYRALRGCSPEELLFATWLDALEDDGADALATGLEKMVEKVHGLAQAAGATASFAVVVSDGSCLITLRTATQGPPPPLYTIVAEEGAPLPSTGRVVASEPLFPGAWSSLDPHSLVIFTVEADEAADEETDS